MQESLALLNYKIQRYELGLMASRSPVVSSPESATHGTDLHGTHHCPMDQERS